MAEASGIETGAGSATALIGVPYCVDLVGGPYLTTDPEHIEAFRPRR